jgi:hypothetical protein
LTYIIADEVLLITTPIEASKRRFTQVYPVPEMAWERDELLAGVSILNDDEATPSMAIVRGQLVVRGTFDQHERIRELLRLLDKKP